MICLKHQQQYSKEEYCIYCGGPEKEVKSTHGVRVNPLMEAYDEIRQKGGINDGAEMGCMCSQCSWQRKKADKEGAQVHVHCFIKDGLDHIDHKKCCDCKLDTTTPPPGSKSAVVMGCTCAVYDNHHGEGFDMGEAKPAFWITISCPLHGDK